jgi:hypothetical protein
MVAVAGLTRNACLDTPTTRPVSTSALFTLVIFAKIRKDKKK